MLQHHHVQQLSIWNLQVRSKFITIDCTNNQVAPKTYKIIDVGCIDKTLNQYKTNTFSQMLSNVQLLNYVLHLVYRACAQHWATCLHVLLLHILLDTFIVNQIVLDTHRIERPNECPPTSRITAKILTCFMFLHLDSIGVHYFRCKLMEGKHKKKHTQIYTHYLQSITIDVSALPGACHSTHLRVFMCSKSGIHHHRLPGMWRGKEKIQLQNRLSKATCT